jgi:hypothetical protein
MVSSNALLIEYRVRQYTNFSVKSEYAFVHSACFGVQPDADRRPERQSVGMCCVSGL